MPLDEQQSETLQELMSQLDALSESLDKEGNADILAAVYDLVVAIYERYPELEDEDDEE